MFHVRSGVVPSGFQRLASLQIHFLHHTELSTRCMAEDNKNPRKRQPPMYRCIMALRASGLKLWYHRMHMHNHDKRTTEPPQTMPLGTHAYVLSAASFCKRMHLAFANAQRGACAKGRKFGRVDRTGSFSYEVTISKGGGGHLKE